MISELPDCTTWECVNSFSSWIAAFGTILIAALALWLSWKDRLIRVKASFDYGLVPGENQNVLDREVYVLAFTNIGHRTATVTNYEWRIRHWPKLWRSIRMITFPHLDHELQNLCSKFPVELNDGKEGHVFHKASFFQDLEEKEGHLFSSSTGMAFYRIFTFKIILRTTVGKDINVHIPFRVRKHVWKRYRKIET